MGVAGLTIELASVFEVHVTPIVNVKGLNVYVFGIYLETMKTLLDVGSTSDSLRYCSKVRRFPDFRGTDRWTKTTSYKHQ